MSEFMQLIERWSTWKHGRNLAGAERIHLLEQLSREIELELRRITAQPQPVTVSAE